MVPMDLEVLMGILDPLEQQDLRDLQVRGWRFKAKLVLLEPSLIQLLETLGLSVMRYAYTLVAGGLVSLLG